MAAAANMRLILLNFPSRFASKTLLSKFINVTPCGLTSVRHTRYDSRHLDPTVDRLELDSPLAEDDPRKFQPIKAALNEHTSSVTYDAIASKFVRMMLQRGNKDAARRCMDRTFEHIKLSQVEKYHKCTDDEQKQDIELDPLTIFHKAIENCQPLLITQNTRRGGITYTVPVPCNPSYKMYKSMRWLIDSCKAKDKDRRFWHYLAQELIAASNNQGRAIRKKQELHKLCEANRAYAHYRW